MTRILAVIGFVSLLALSTGAAASYEDGAGNGNDTSGMTITDANTPPDLPAEQPPAEAQTLTPGQDGGAVAGQDAGLDQDPASEAQFIQPTTQHVTSLQKCLDLLDPEDAAEVRLNPEHPYQECHARLADKAARKRTLKIAKEKHTDEPEAENARNYKRVHDDSEPEAAGSKAIGEAMTSDSGYWSAKTKPVTAAQPPSHEERAPASLMPDDEDETVHKKGSSHLSWLPSFSSIKPDNSKGSYNN